mmetsp:Transcript_7993/g.15632  ORF Transcript_7993/g.15632 Transcript_7993/m.15632 type:complete len:335 (-) Transcript_7993:339-1343(-)
MGQTVTNLYVNAVYGSGCPKNGERVRRTQDYTPEKIKAMTWSQKKEAARLLGIDRPIRSRDPEVSSAEEKKFIAAASSAVHRGKSADHKLWDEILKACISRGTIRDIEVNTFDYEKLLDAKSPEGLGAKYDAYLNQLANMDEKGLSVNDRLATLFNAYNALCVGHIVRAMRSGKDVSSILKLNTDKLKIWDQKAGKLFGQEVTLSDVEHKLLRAKYADARLHACIVCASVSCPDLRGEAFVGGDRLDEQMTDQMKGWLANQKKGFNTKAEGKGVLLSSIFTWFQGDFKPNVMTFIAPYLPEKFSAFRKTSKCSLEYMPYDWGINSKKASEAITE